jgi:hypothetical protein
MVALAGGSYSMSLKTPGEHMAMQGSYAAHVESALSDECFTECDPHRAKMGRSGMA